MKYLLANISWNMKYVYMKISKEIFRYFISIDCSLFTSFKVVLCIKYNIDPRPQLSFHFSFGKYTFQQTSKKVNLCAMGMHAYMYECLIFAIFTKALLHVYWLIYHIYRPLIGERLQYIIGSTPKLWICKFEFSGWLKNLRMVWCGQTIPLKSFKNLNQSLRDIWFFRAGSIFNSW